MTTSLKLKAIDGANPLGFLAALGALRLSSLQWPERNIALQWQLTASYTPQLSGIPAPTEEALCEALLQAPAVPVDEFTLLGKNITVAPDTFRDFAEAAGKGSSRTDRRAADFASAFGCEDCPDDKNERIRYSQLCFITGSGHQDFLGTMSALRNQVTAEHLHEALFGGWRNGNKGLAFRWDPIDAREYALRWGDPSKEGAWSTWGVNRLALEALPLFPTQPQTNKLITTGFTSRRRRGEARKDEFTWPIWIAPLECDEVRSLVALSAFQEEAPDRDSVRARGVLELFRATRIRIGQGANFKVSFRAPRSV